MTTEGWGVFRGDGTPHDVTWPEPPPWRRFGNRVVPRPVEAPFPYVIADGDRDVVNTALHLHRPLLVTGKPGTGKSTLARAVARELRLGEVLHWPVNSRTTLADGLYRYDAVGRLRDASMKGREAAEPDIGDYLRLGALGTALLPHDRPRVLLVDELDKGDVDLPNDLLTVFEEGRYEIPELSRLKGSDVRVRVTGSDEKVTVTDGMVSCRTFPVVVITSNGERDFPRPSSGAAYAWTSSSPARNSCARSSPCTWARSPPKRSASSPTSSTSGRTTRSNSPRTNCSTPSICGRPAWG